MGVHPFLNMKLMRTKIAHQPHANPKVIESFFSIAGLIYVVLQCETGLIQTGAKLLSDSGETWIVVENNLLIGRRTDFKLQEKVKAQRLFRYRLETLQRNLRKPEPGTMLKVNPV